MAFKRVKLLGDALERSTVSPGTLDSELEVLRQRLFAIDEALRGNRSAAAFGEPQAPTVSGRLRLAGITNGQTDYGPTSTHLRALELAANQFAEIEPELRETIEVALPALEAQAGAAGVPWSPWRPLPE
jgi:hypothetical protein